MSRLSLRPAFAVAAVGALVVLAFAVDRLILLPRLEAGGGGMSNGAKIAVWLLVNLAPPTAAALLARTAGQRMPVVAALTVAAAAITGIAALVALLAYIAAEGGLE
jgi:hypothetical protein